MNPTGYRFDRMKLREKRFALLLFLPLLCALVTGCPHNEYTVELKPQADGLERTLTFYRADGVNSNGVPNYQKFPSNELAAIMRVYPVGAVKSDGERWTATGEFGSTLPDDVGGAGTYTNLVTSLGSAGFYAERFRGNDDFAGRVARQMQAADQIDDLVIGWAKSEFGRERGWKNLRAFLDKNFRNDLKNAALYYWVANLSKFSHTNASEEFTARFGLYLLERGYFKRSDAPALYSFIDGGSDETFIQHCILRLVAERLEISTSASAAPKSPAALKDAAAFEKSWEKYLAKTDRYRAQVKAWEQKRKTNPNLEKPKPLDAMNGLFAELLTGIADGGETDQLVVKLSLPQPPNHSNGHWQDGQVIWQADLEPARAVPAFCFANWSQPDGKFQKAHFGHVLLSGDALAQYCLWQAGLDEQTVRAWESFLTGLQPGGALRERLEAYQFTLKPGETNPPDAGRRLLMEALPKETKPSSAGSK